MKIKTTVTEIECTANELRQSNTLSDGFYNMLRGCFNHMNSDCGEEEEQEQEDGNDD